MNPLDDPQNFQNPICHPCSKRLKDIPKNEQEQFYIDLANKCQSHECRLGYCLKTKLVEGETIQFCRFGAPWDLKLKTELVFEEKELKKGGTK